MMASMMKDLGRHEQNVPGRPGCCSCSVSHFKIMVSLTETRYSSPFQTQISDPVLFTQNFAYQVLPCARQYITELLNR